MIIRGYGFISINKKNYINKVVYDNINKRSINDAFKMYYISLGCKY